jgi:aspartyl-tRNA(Asn)/glutamyl-tRNA(Gln) amidotransferase subunit A
MPAAAPSTAAWSEAAREEIARLSAAALAQAFRRRTLSPVEVTALLLDRIEALDGPVNAVVLVDRAYALVMAREAEARFAAGAPLCELDGVPVTIKDLSAVKGLPRRRGSRALDPRAPSPEDTPCVARLREAGLVVLAKTATPEAGCKVVTRSLVHGVTANPYDLSRTPGGSSGGASAALAMGFGPLAQGSDGAGSIRIPAAWTNVFGLKPGFGRVPAHPDIDMPHSVVGPMAREVADAAAMLAIMSRPDPRDPFVWPVPFVPPEDLHAPDLAGVRVAVSPRLSCTVPLADPEMDRIVAEAGPLLAAAGARVAADDPVWPVDPALPFSVFWRLACLATVEGFPPEKRPLLDPLLLAIADAGRVLGVTDHLAAMEQRLAMSVAAVKFFAGYDLLVGPVIPVPAFAVTRDVPESFADEDWSWCPYTYPWNMTGQPAASVPIGFTRTGLPVGVQIIGRMGEEALVLRAAAAIEAQRPLFRTPPPPVEGYRS